ncbi:MAG: hypothetical protein IJ437_03035 [Clostridia bacterium]|nr:hypothetical protein [Clostridia bacterium]
MILIVDNNEERRRNVTIWLRVKGYLVSCIGYDDLKYSTKPFMTVYVNPARDYIDKIKNKDTISVIFSERNSINLPEWSINISSLKSISKDIMELYEESCSFQRTDKVDIIGYACMKDGQFALGGKVIRLSPREREIISLFMFNYPKKFELYDAINYFRITDNQEEKFLNAIYLLNKKAQANDREKIIINENNTFYFNPKIGNYVCPEVDFEDRYAEVDKYKGYFTIDLLEF